MHAVAIQLAPVMAAEKSKVPFYIAGGALVVWALVLSVAIGMRKADFPSSVVGERAVIAITAVLVIAAASMAVATSSVPAKTGTTSSSTSGGGAQANASARSDASAR